MKIPPIPLPIKKLMCSPRFAEIAENTVVAVSVETGLKMIGRPTFILADKKADSESKKYSSVKEFLYQGTCLALYLAIVPFVKKGINNIIINRLSRTIEKKGTDKLILSRLKNSGATKITTDLFKNTHLAKGAKELSAIIGSVVTLAILAPQLSHYIVHPMMKVLGFDKKPEGAKAQSVPQVNVKA